MELSPLLLICILQLLGNFLFHDEMIMIAHSYRYFHNEEEYKYLINIFNYSGVFFSFIYFLTADILRYRSLIVISSISLLLRYLLFFHHPTMFLIHVSILLQALSGKWLRAVLPYMYAIEDTSKYQKITTYALGSEILCLFFSSIWNRIYKQYGTSGALTPNAPIYLNAIMLCIVLPCSCILPAVDSKRGRDAGGMENLHEVDMTGYGNQKPNILDNLRTGVIRQWNNFKVAFADRNVLKWSIWYSIVAYMAPLNSYFNTFLIDLSTNEPFGTNSLIYVILHLSRTLIIIFGLIFYSRKPTNWKTKGDQILCWGSFVLLALTILQYFYLHQIFQIIIMKMFQIIVEVFCVICLWEIAQTIPRNSYALVIGFVMFVTDVLDAATFPAYPSDYIDTKIIFIHAVLFALLGIGFGISARKSLSGQSDQRGVSLE